MRITQLASVVSVALLGTTAFAQNITYDYDKAADFSRFRTYTWVRGTPPNDELNHRRIVNAVDSQLAEKLFNNYPPSH